MATHSSVLAWRIPGMGKPAGLLSMGSQSRTRLKRLSSSSSSMENGRGRLEWIHEELARLASEFSIYGEPIYVSDTFYCMISSSSHNCRGAEGKMVILNSQWLPSLLGVTFKALHHTFLFTWPVYFSVIPSFFFFLKYSYLLSFLALSLWILKLSLANFWLAFNDSSQIFYFENAPQGPQVLAIVLRSFLF